jgi:hypothetical protein
MFQIPNQSLTHRSFQRNRVLLLSLPHATPNAYLLVMASDFRFHPRCSDHRVFADMVQVVNAVLRSLDARRHLLRWLTHATRWRCNSQGGTTFRSSCNRGNRLSDFIFHLSLLRGTNHSPSHTYGRMLLNCTLKGSSGHGIAISLQFSLLCTITKAHGNRNPLNLNTKYELHNYVCNSEYLDTTVIL